MKVSVYLGRTLAITLALALASYTVSSPVLADMVPTGQLAGSARLESARDRADSLLQQEQVSAMLADMGVDAQAARDRVATLSAEELEQLSNRMDELPAGEGALGTIALVLVILILLDVAGVTDIFPSV